MKKVALWGYYGFGNVGDEALLHATLPYLENTNVRLFSGDVPSVTESKNLQIVPRSLKNLLSTTRNTDAFVLGPGGLLHERKKIRGTWAHLAGPLLAKRHKKPFCAVGQQIGPFARTSTRNFVRNVLRHAEFITTRDDSSFEMANKLDLHPIESSDMAFLLDVDTPSQEIHKKVESLPKPILVFSPAVSDEFELDIKACANILNSFAEMTSSSIVLVPFFQGRDDTYLGKLYPHIKTKNVLKLTSPLSWQDAFGIFKLADYSITMRLHSMVASAIAGVPSLPIVYHKKIEMIGQSLGYKMFLEPALGNFDKTFEGYISSYEQSQNTLKERVKSLRQKAKISGELLEKFVNQSI